MIRGASGYEDERKDGRCGTAADPGFTRSSINAIFTRIERIVVGTLCAENGPRRRFVAQRNLGSVFVYAAVVPIARRNGYQSSRFDSARRTRTNREFVKMSFGPDNAVTAPGFCGGGTGTRANSADRDVLCTGEMAAA